MFEILCPRAFVLTVLSAWNNICSDSYMVHFLPHPLYRHSNVTVIVKIYVSVWLDHGMPRYLVKCCFWLCLWGCFQERLAFKLVNWVKWFALNVDGCYLLRALVEQKVEERLNCLSAWLYELGYWSAFGTPSSQAFRVGLDPTIGCWLLGFWTIPPAVVHLQVTDVRSWDFSTSIITWANTL